MGICQKPLQQARPLGGALSQWCPAPNAIVKKQLNKNNGNNKPFYCNAIGGSQGQDWITTYAYNLLVVNGEPQHLAYVECDYVQ